MNIKDTRTKQKNISKLKFEYGMCKTKDEFYDKCLKRYKLLIVIGIITLAAIIFICYKRELNIFSVVFICFTINLLTNTIKDFIESKARKKGNGIKLEIYKKELDLLKEEEKKEIKKEEEEKGNE